MGSRRLPLLVTAVAALVLAVSGAAWADTTVSINPGNVPTTASGFATHECNENLGGGPLPGQDIWVFNLPDGGGPFISVTATFSTPTGTVIRTIPTDGGSIVQIGTSKAFIAVPAGWTLTGATAVITGTAEFFVLTHTCPAGPGTTPTPTPTPTPSGSPSPSVSPSVSPSESPSESPSGSPTTSPPTDVPTSGPSDTPGTTPTSTSPGGGLPTTGAATLSIVVVGLAMVAGGVALLMIRRRRDAGVDGIEEPPAI